MERRRPYGTRVIATGVVVAVVLAPNAAADGLPVLGVDVGKTGVLTEEGDVRLVTLATGPGTLVARISASTGAVQRARAFGRRVTIPAVAYDGSADGISADGSTLTLIEPRVAFPRARTGFLILDGRTLAPRGFISLRGDFSFDAISPDGRRMFLVRYRSPRDPNRYEVRSYDLVARRLGPPIVDPTEPDEQMGGQPVTRAWSPDRRWAYTLYQRAGEAPFIHALDTVNATARCVDLDALPGNVDMSGYRLATTPDGGTLTLSNRGEPRLNVDTRTFAVRAVETAVPAQGTRFPWASALAAVGLAACAGALAVIGLRRRQRPVDGRRRLTDLRWRGPTGGA